MTTFFMALLILHGQTIVFRGKVKNFRDNISHASTKDTGDTHIIDYFVIRPISGEKPPWGSK